MVVLRIEETLRRILERERWSGSVDVRAREMMRQSLSGYLRSLSYSARHDS